MWYDDDIDDDSDDAPGEHDHDQGVEDERDEHQQGHHHAVDRQHL